MGMFKQFMISNVFKSILVLFAGALGLLALVSLSPQSQKPSDSMSESLQSSAKKESSSIPDASGQTTGTRHNPFADRIKAQEAERQVGLPAIGNEEKQVTMPNSHVPGADPFMAKLIEQNKQVSVSPFGR